MDSKEKTLDKRINDEAIYRENELKNNDIYNYLKKNKNNEEKEEEEEDLSDPINFVNENIINAVDNIPEKI